MNDPDIILGQYVKTAIFQFGSDSLHAYISVTALSLRLRKVIGLSKSYLFRGFPKLEGPHHPWTTTRIARTVHGKPPPQISASDHDPWPEAIDRRAHCPKREERLNRNTHSGSDSAQSRVPYSLSNFQNPPQAGQITNCDFILLFGRPQDRIKNLDVLVSL